MTATRTAETDVMESAESSLALCATAAQKRTPMYARRNVGTRATITIGSVTMGTTEFLTVATMAVCLKWALSVTRELQTRFPTASKRVETAAIVDGTHAMMGTW